MEESGSLFSEDGETDLEGMIYHSALNRLGMGKDNWKWDEIEPKKKYFFSFFISSMAAGHFSVRNAHMYRCV